MNARNRAHLDAGSVVGAQAGDDIGHSNVSRINWFKPFESLQPPPLSSPATRGRMKEGTNR
jgi:hypothetical protein